MWYEGRSDSRRSDVRMRKGLLDLVGVEGCLMYDCARSGAEGVP